MKEVYDFLKKCGTYYLATVDNGEPRVRPFGTVNIFDGKLYIQTGKVKPTYQQIKTNPIVEISAFLEGKWIRLTGKLVEDDRREARKSMLDAYPELRAMYSEDDGNTVVFYFVDAVAKIYSFGGPVQEFKF